MSYIFARNLSRKWNFRVNCMIPGVKLTGFTGLQQLLLLHFSLSRRPVLLESCTYTQRGSLPFPKHASSQCLPVRSFWFLVHKEHCRQRTYITQIRQKLKFLKHKAFYPMIPLSGQFNLASTLGCSDFRNLIGFTNKIVQNNILNNFC
jgi:hypothetical protein